MQSRIEIPCAQCGTEDSLTMLSLSSEIPYFGEHTQITILCEHCRWKHTDFIPSEGKKPGFWSIALDSIDKLTSRIVRSSSCTIRIPQLDLEVTPSGSSSGFVSNIEGVINRFEKVVGTVIRGSSDSRELIQKANNILDDLNIAKSGEKKIEIILLDPRGRSQIIHNEAESRELTIEEVAELETGPDLPVFSI
tara:strand:- start:2641 stop:3219 length:579 start_codon:yes stop_codon:yes gene_type:complete